MRVRSLVAGVGVATLVFVLSLGLAKSLKKEFVPSQDQSRFLIRVQTALGTSLEVTESCPNPPITMRYTLVRKG